MGREILKTSSGLCVYVLALLFQACKYVGKRELLLNLAFEWVHCTRRAIHLVFLWIGHKPLIKH